MTRSASSRSPVLSSTPARVPHRVDHRATRHAHVLAPAVQLMTAGARSVPATPRQQQAGAAMKLPPVSGGCDSGGWQASSWQLAAGGVSPPSTRILSSLHSSPEARQPSITRSLPALRASTSSCRVAWMRAREAPTLCTPMACTAHTARLSALPRQRHAGAAPLLTSGMLAAQPCLCRRLAWRLAARAARRRGRGPAACGRAAGGRRTLRQLSSARLYTSPKSKKRRSRARSSSTPPRRRICGRLGGRGSGSTLTAGACAFTAAH